MKAVIIGGTVSGVGKTTVSTGLMAALCRRGLKVQPFKVGPDYIDPGYHALATGEISRNLDTWMVSPGGILELFHRAMRGKELAVIEGVMGLYDGRSSINDEGSTAELAKLLRVPVILVLDSKKGARSLAAMVMGYQLFDKSVQIGGVILNGIGSQTHFDLCREAIEHFTQIPVLGYLPKQNTLSMPERHLGLVPTVERPATKEFINLLTAQCESTFDLDKIINLAALCSIPKASGTLFPDKSGTPEVIIGIARDKAFSFYYQDNLELLEAWGAKLAFFSPLKDSALPADISGLYIGGGFPELYAAELSGNITLKRQINKCIEDGMPVYAECGGLMYLGQRIVDFDAHEYPMVGAIESTSRIDNHRLNLGYRTVQALSDGPLMRKGEIIRGHEFHWSVLDGAQSSQNAYSILGKNRIEGFQKGGLLASYIHLHFAALPSIPARFVKNCKNYHDRNIENS